MNKKITNIGSLSLEQELIWLILLYVGIGERNREVKRETVMDGNRERGERGQERERERERES